jgi:hypothetical protein
MLREVERLRSLVQERDRHIEALDQERKALPSLIETNANQHVIKKLQSEMEELKF